MAMAMAKAIPSCSDDRSRRGSPTAESVPARPPLRPVAPWSASPRYPWRWFYRIGVLVIGAQASPGILLLSLLRRPVADGEVHVVVA
eukprot:3801397-Pyramimonas_sp.AAC.1